MSGEASTEVLKVALDWTPNTIHTGLFVALSRNLYSNANLSVQLLPPDLEYTKTPAKRLEGGEVDLAICPSESCIAYNETRRMKLQAIYAILQKDASAIVSTKPEFADMSAFGSGGAVYGSYNAKYEDDIVRAMVGFSSGTDKGQGSVKITNQVGKLSLFEAMKSGNVDATWIFLPWEGVEAELEGLHLNVFRTEDHGVPYGYSPVVARNAEGGVSEDALERFVSATREGYEYAMANPVEAAAIIRPHCQPQRSAEFLERSQKRINEYYVDGVGAPGCMQKEKWQIWVDWLRRQGLLKAEISIDDISTNAFTS